MSIDFRQLRLTPEDRRFLRAVNRGLRQRKKLIDIASELEVSPQTITQKIARLGFRIDKQLVPMNISESETAA